MALINCPECGRQVSDTATRCPGCGYTIAKNNNFLDKIIDYFLNKQVVFGVCFVAIICLIIFFKWDKASENRGATDYDSNIYSFESTVNASSIFNNLEMSHFSISLGTHSGKMSCEVLNNNAFTVKGYFYVGFYDSSGKLMYCQLMSLPSVESGEKVICSSLIPKSDYPSEYSYVEYSQATLIKE